MSSRLVTKADTLKFFVIITKELVIALKHDTLPRKIRGMTHGIGFEVMGTTATCWTSD